MIQRKNLSRADRPHSHPMRRERNYIYWWVLLTLILLLSIGVAGLIVSLSEEEDTIVSNANELDETKVSLHPPPFPKVILFLNDA